MTYKRVAYCDGEHPRTKRKCRATAVHGDIDGIHHWCSKHTPLEIQTKLFGAGQFGAAPYTGMMRNEVKNPRLTLREMKPDHE